MIQKPKGTYDVYGKEGREVRYLESLFEALMHQYHYSYIRTPIFESSDLFHRGVGETTDIVTKETYDFKDRGNRDMTLRPEGTAGVVRSFIENKMYGDVNQPIKTWYSGTMYRYERPQSGRFREFHQLGIEVFGSEDAIVDAEVISVVVQFYKLLGLKGIKVKINSLGDNESRSAYHHALVEYFKPHVESLCEDCQARFQKNPLRILDCKIDHEKEIMKHAPKMIDYLNEESKMHFKKVQMYLDALDIPYHVSPNLVRGLDYYTHTVFEVEADIKEFGSNNVLCGGGRYNHLVETLGGPSTPAVGVAIGIERVLNALHCEEIDIVPDDILDIYVIPLSEEQKIEAAVLTQALRLSGFQTEMDTMNRSMKANFKASERLHATYIVLLGEEEVKSQVVTIKDNHTKEEYKVPMDEVVDFFSQNEGECHCSNIKGCCNDE